MRAEPGDAAVDAAEEPEPPRRFSLSTRVTLLAAICVAGAVALVSLGAYLTVRSNLYGQARQNLLTEAGNTASTAQYLPNCVAVLLPSNNKFNDVRISVIDGTGAAVPLCNTGNMSNGQQFTYTVPSSLIGPDEKGVAANSSQQLNTGLPAETETENNNMVVAVGLPGGQGLALVAAQPLTNETEILNRLSLVLFLISGAGIVVAALAGTAVATGGLRPVARLTAATERVATGDLQPLPVTGDDELARLTTSFNAMLGALAESQEQQRRLVADAGHELRTPLTSLRTNLELLIAASKPDTPTLSPQDTTDLHHDVRAQLDELTTLIGDLVELARQDTPHTIQEPLELTDILDRALHRARRRTTTITFDVTTTGWTLLGDAPALERAILNLLDNAVKFSPPGGHVRVTLRPL
ncbi:MAG TPA: histidine kinase dimerization/phospho-acceptor domain-containing protein, partial [Pseudonocardiaceae bacterium]|nr:histidine kinase dimerization/phospho-acceptor domain-containing protein [Pseudonocardiaceae bacterium]